MYKAEQENIENSIGNMIWGVKYYSMGCKSAVSYIHLLFLSAEYLQWIYVT